MAEVVRRYGDVPVCLVGMDMGARAALRAAGHPVVASVLALVAVAARRRRSAGRAGDAGGHRSDGASR